MPYVAGVPAPLLELYPLLHGRHSPKPLSCCSSFRRFVRAHRESHTRRTSLRPSVPTASCVATPPTTCQQPCSLSSREYNMMDGHGRTTVGHRTVRGQGATAAAAAAVVLLLLLPCVFARSLVCSLTHSIVHSLAHSLACLLACVARSCVPERAREKTIDGEGREKERRADQDTAVRFRPRPLRATLDVSLRSDSPDWRDPHTTTQTASEAGNATHVWHYFRSGQSGRSARSLRRHLSTWWRKRRPSAPFFKPFELL